MGWGVGGKVESGRKIEERGEGRGMGRKSRVRGGEENMEGRGER